MSCACRMTRCFKTITHVKSLLIAALQVDVEEVQQPPSGAAQ